MEDIIKELVRLLQREIRDVNDRSRKISCHGSIMIVALALKEVYCTAILNPENEEHRTRLTQGIDKCNLVLMEINTKKYTNGSINELIRKVKNL